MSAIPPVAIANPAALASIHSGAEPSELRLPAHEHHVAGERTAAERATQVALGRGVEIAA